jgi:hypothetical protein
VPKAYLGDGVYADFDGFAVVLTTEDGISVQNRIVLEPEVIAAFEAYVARLRAPAEPPPARTSP